MRVIEIPDHGPSDVLEMTEYPIPTPSSSEVLIDVEAIGVNFADIEQRRGNYPETPEPPFVPGMEVAGTICETGPDTEQSVGAQVVALLESGGYAETVTVPTDRIFLLPDSVDTRTAVGFPVQFLTAYHALYGPGDLKSGDRVLIHAAAGGVGTAAVQIADAAGAEIFGTASTTEKLTLAAELGVDTPINYENQNIADEINRCTENTGVDIVLDGVGGKIFYKSLEVLADFGRIISYGVASGNVPAAATPRLLFENKSVHGFHLGHAFKKRPNRIKWIAPELLRKIATGELQVIVDEKFPLEEAPFAHEYIENRESVGKVILET